MANGVKDLQGAKVGKLTVVRQNGRDSCGRAMWLCRCDCGEVVTKRSAVIVAAIRGGKKSSCGCSPFLKTHGLSKSNKRLHWVWASMVQRCENPSNKDYPNYGGRGITVCPDWRRDFACFYGWAAASGYRPGVTIERVDVDRGYCPENCTWVKNERQCLNQHNSMMITFRGKTQHLSDWARETGIGYKTLRGRLTQYGWDVERALTEKPKKGKNQYG